MIAFENVSKQVSGRTVLDRITLEFPRGSSIGILGGRRSGKSTLLRLIAGLEQPSTGRITRRARISWPLGQKLQLEGPVSATDNLRMIARIHGAPLKRTIQDVKDFAELGGEIDAPWSELERATRSRILAGLWLAMDFDCYLIDDPPVMLGGHFRRKFRSYFEQRRSGAWIIAAGEKPASLRPLCAMGGVLQDGGLSLYDTFRGAAVSYRRSGRSEQWTSA